MGNAGLSNNAWQVHTNALFETAGKYPKQNYNWLFGSLFMIFVMIITSRIDGSCANYLFLFNRINHHEDTMPCMPSQFQFLSARFEKRNNDVLHVNMMRWTYNVCTLLTTNISPDFLFILFADYTKLMGTRMWGIMWLVFMWIAYDKIQNMPTNTSSELVPEMQRYNGDLHCLCSRWVGEMFDIRLTYYVPGLWDTDGFCAFNDALCTNPERLHV